MNLYSFAGDDPVNGSDPTGLGPDPTFFDDLNVVGHVNWGNPSLAPWLIDTWYRNMAAIGARQPGSRPPGELARSGGGGRGPAPKKPKPNVIYIRTPSQCFVDNNAWMGAGVAQGLASIGTGVAGGLTAGGLALRAQAASIVRQTFETGYASDFTKTGVATVAAALPYLRAGARLLRAGVFAAIVPAYLGASRSICQLSPSYGLEQ